MKKVVGRSDLFIAAGCLLLGFLFIESSRTDPLAHHRYEGVMDRLARIETRINEDVLRAGAGLLPHYDSLVSSARDRQGAIELLSTSPSYLGEAERAQFQADLETYVKAVESKTVLEERFKMLHSAVRGSMTYFPIVGRGLLERLEQQGGSHAVSDTVREGVARLFEFMAVGGATERLAARRAIDRVAAIDASLLPDESAALFETAITHARNVLMRKPQLDRLIEDVVRAETGMALATLRATYQSGHAQAQRRGMVFERALYLCAAIMLILVAVILRRLIAARERLDGSNADLEERVAERTKELTRTKAQLERDAHTLRELNDRLQVSYRELDQTRVGQLETRDKFLSHVSHELRTPLTVVHQFISLVLDGVGGDVTEQHREYLDVAFRNVDQLNRMIADLMEVTRARSGKLRLECQPTEIRDLVADVCATFESKMADAEISLRFEADEQVPQAYADPVRIRQILNNLIENAIKFTPMGGSVGVKLESEEDSGMLRVSVRDTGCGIERDSLSRVFEQLHQEGAAESRSRKGLGLGLAICRELVERQDGRIWVESRVGEGSVFQFTVPEFRLERLVSEVVVHSDHVAPECCALRVGVEPDSVGNLNEVVRREVRHKLRNLIYRETDVVLPRLVWDARREDFWIVAETGSVGEVALRSRIIKALESDAQIEGVRFEFESRVFEVEAPGDGTEGFDKSIGDIARFLRDQARQEEKT